MASYVELYSLSKTYPLLNGDKAVIVVDFNLEVAKGEFITVIGHSGCGKTTVLMMAAGLLENTTGGIVVDYREVIGPGPDRAVVFQSPCLMPWLTAFQNVMLGVKQVYPHASAQERKDICEYYLSIVGLGEAMGKYPEELSGGMQQRVGIARAFALSPKLLLLDEPFGKLDSLTRMELQDVLTKLLQERNMTAIMITHDVDEAVLLADRVVMMTNGPAASIGEIVEIPFPHPRVRDEVMDNPDYYRYRGRLLTFLEEQDLARAGGAKKSRLTASRGTDTPARTGHVEAEVAVT